MSFYLRLITFLLLIFSCVLVGNGQALTLVWNTDETNNCDSDGGLDISSDGRIITATQLEGPDCVPCEGLDANGGCDLRPQGMCGARTNILTSTVDISQYASVQIRTQVSSTNSEDDECGGCNSDDFGIISIISTTDPELIIDTGECGNSDASALSTHTVECGELLIINILTKSNAEGSNEGFIFNIDITPSGTFQHSDAPSLVSQTPDIANDASYEVDESVTLTANFNCPTGDCRYQWIDGLSNIVQDGPTSEYTATVSCNPDENLYSVIAIPGNGCVDTESIVDNLASFILLNDQLTLAALENEIIPIPNSASRDPYFLGKNELNFNELSFAGTYSGTCVSPDGEFDFATMVEGINEFSFTDSDCNQTYQFKAEFRGNQGAVIVACEDLPPNDSNIIFFCQGAADYSTATFNFGEGTFSDGNNQNIFNADQSMLLVSGLQVGEYNFTFTPDAVTVPNCPAKNYKFEILNASAAADLLPQGVTYCSGDVAGISVDTLFNNIPGSWFLFNAQNPTRQAVPTMVNFSNLNTDNNPFTLSFEPDNSDLTCFQNIDFNFSVLNPNPVNASDYTRTLSPEKDFYCIGEEVILTLVGPEACEGCFTWVELNKQVSNTNEDNVFEFNIRDWVREGFYNELLDENILHVYLKDGCQTDSTLIAIYSFVPSKHQLNITDDIVPGFCSDYANQVTSMVVFDTPGQFKEVAGTFTSNDGYVDPNGTFNLSEMGTGSNPFTFTDDLCNESVDFSVDIYSLNMATPDPIGPFCQQDKQIALNDAFTQAGLEYNPKVNGIDVDWSGDNVDATTQTLNINAAPGVYSMSFKSEIFRDSETACIFGELDYEIQSISFSDIDLCNTGDQINLADLASISLPGNGEFSDPSGTLLMGFTGLDNRNFDPTGMPADNYTIEYSVPNDYDQFCSTFTFNMSISDPMDMDIALEDECELNTLAIELAEVITDEVGTAVPGTFTLNGSDIQNLNPSSLGNGTYTVDFIPDNLNQSCFTANLTLNIIEPSASMLSTRDTSICEISQEVDLTVLIDGVGAAITGTFSESSLDLTTPALFSPAGLGGQTYSVQYDQPEIAGCVPTDTDNFNLEIVQVDQEQVDKVFNPNDMNTVNLSTVFFNSRPSVDGEFMLNGSPISSFMPSDPQFVEGQTYTIAFQPEDVNNDNACVILSYSFQIVAGVLAIAPLEYCPTDLTTDLTELATDGAVTWWSGDPDDNGIQIAEPQNALISELLPVTIYAIAPDGGRDTLIKRELAPPANPVVNDDDIVCEDADSYSIRYTITEGNEVMPVDMHRADANSDRVFFIDNIPVGVDTVISLISGNTGCVNRYSIPNVLPDCNPGCTPPDSPIFNIPMGSDSIVCSQSELPVLIEITNAQTGVTYDWTDGAGMVINTGPNFEEDGSHGLITVVAYPDGDNSCTASVDGDSPGIIGVFTGIQNPTRSSDCDDAINYKETWTFDDAFLTLEPDNGITVNDMGNGAFLLSINTTVLDSGIVMVSSNIAPSCATRELKLVPNCAVNNVPKPFITLRDVECIEPNLDSYEVFFESDGDIFSYVDENGNTIGQECVSDNFVCFENDRVVSNIPVGTNLKILVGFNNSDGIDSLFVQSPQCSRDCGDIPQAGIIGNAERSICGGQNFPILEIDSVDILAENEIRKMALGGFEGFDTIKVRWFDQEFGGQPISIGFTFQPTEAGMYFAEQHVTEVGATTTDCTSSFRSKFTVEVAAGASSPVYGDYCLGDEITPTINPLGTYRLLNGTGITDITSVGTITDPDCGVTYEVEFTADDMCQTKDTIDVIVSCGTSPITQTGTLSCDDATQTYMVSVNTNGENLSISDANAVIASNGDDYTITNISPGITLTITADGIGGCEDPLPLEIEVSTACEFSCDDVGAPNFAAGIQMPFPICAGNNTSEIQIDPSSVPEGFTIYWYTTAAAANSELPTDTIGSGLTFVPTSGQFTEYFAVITDEVDCYSEERSIAVSPQAQTNANFEYSMPRCAFTMFPLDIEHTGGTFSAVDGNGDPYTGINAQSGMLNNPPPGDYTITYEISGICNDIQMRTITVTEGPAISDSSLVFDAATDTYTFIFKAEADNFNININGLTATGTRPDYMITGILAGQTISVRAINAEGCGGPAISETAPTVGTCSELDPTFSYATPLCDYDVYFPSPLNGGGSYLLLDPQDGATVDPASGELQNPIIGTNYQIEYTTSAGTDCEMRDSIFVLINPVPEIKDTMTVLEDDGSYTLTFTSIGTPDINNIGTLTSVDSFHTVTGIQPGDNISILSMTDENCVSDEFSHIFPQGGDCSPVSAIFSYPLKCENALIPNSIAGGVFSFVNPVDADELIDPQTGEITNAVAGNMYQIVYTTNPGRSCEESFVEEITVLPAPVVSDVTEPMCDDVNGGYMFNFTAVGDPVIQPATIDFTKNGDVYTITGIPANQTFTFSILGGIPVCESDIIEVVIPEVSCTDCATVATPSLLVDNPLDLCEGMEFEGEVAEVPSGFDIFWYDENGDLVSEGPNPPLSSGTYFGEATDRASCQSAERLELEIRTLEVESAEFTLVNVCGNDEIIPTDFTPGGTFSLVENPTTQTTIDEATGQVIDPVPGELYMVRYITPDLVCPDTITKPVTISEAPQFDSVIECDIANSSYTVKFVTDADVVESGGIAPLEGMGDTLVLENLDENTTVDLILELPETACRDTIAIANTCDCPIISPPVVENPEPLCSGEAFLLTAELEDPNTQTVVWFNSEAGGTEVDPMVSVAGDYFAEAQEGPCVSSQRSRVVVSFLPSPDAGADIDIFGDNKNNIPLRDLVPSQLGDFESEDFPGAIQDEILLTDQLAIGENEILYIISDVDCGSDTAVISVNIEDLKPGATVTGSVVNVGCQGESTGALTIRISEDQITYNFFYEDDAGTRNPLDPDATSLEATIEDIPAGTYRIIVFDDNDVELDNPSEFVVSEPEALTVAAEVAKQIACSGADDATLRAAVTGGTGPYSFVWDTGDTNQELLNIAEGDYTVTVTDGNMCIDEGSTSVTDTEVLSFDANAIPPLCEDLPNGTIMVDNVTGGEGPYLYSINGGRSFQDDPLFNFVDTGSYEITIKDQRDCIPEVTEINISDYTGASGIDLLDEKFLNPGEDYQLPLEFSDGFAPQTIRWFGEGLSCNDCQQPSIIAPEEPTFYAVEIIDQSGCVFSENIVIQIWGPPEIYLPNSIASDPINKRENRFFFPYLNGDFTGTTDISIYDQWGELIFELTNADLADPRQGWDGTFNGRPDNEFREDDVNKNVYVYRVKVRIDGRTEELDETGTIIVF